MPKNRKEIFMCAKVLRLKFVGMDSWDRLVYRDDAGMLWKDVDPRAGMKLDLCTSVNNEFDGEPCRYKLAILVNFFGTFITTGDLPIDYPEYNKGFIDSEEEWGFTGDMYISFDRVIKSESAG